MCQHPPAPLLDQTLNIKMAVRCSNVLDENDTMLKQLWFFTVKTQPHLIL